MQRKRTGEGNEGRKKRGSFHRPFRPGRMGWRGRKKTRHHFHSRYPYLFGAKKEKVQEKRRKKKKRVDRWNLLVRHALWGKKRARGKEARSRLVTGKKETIKGGEQKKGKKMGARIVLPD